MRFPAALLLSGMLAIPTVRAETQVLSGIVTRASSRSDFDVNGIHIECGTYTNSGVTVDGRTLGQRGCPKTTPYVGQAATVQGALDDQRTTLTAKTIVLSPKSPSAGDVSGSAIIDAIPREATAQSQVSSLLVRADGYRILIPAKALIVWTPPLNALKDVKVGDWIAYQGERRADGAVVAEKVRLTPLVLRKSEEQYRQKRNFDPSKVSEADKQSALSMAFLGVNAKRFPPYDNPQMQARIDAIGSKLVPRWQRDLPDSDPAKIQFRFQLISTKKFRDALALASGVILVPQQVVARMQNDSQLAAVLADNIACVLERQEFRHIHEASALGAGTLAADAAGFFVPGVGLLAPALGYGGGGAMRIQEEDQSGRVALGLLHDAGYDIDEAPKAWWLLASGKPKPISRIDLPRRASYQYRILGEVWNNPAASK